LRLPVVKYVVENVKIPKTNDRSNSGSERSFFK